MRWQGRRESDNVEDLRDQDGGGDGSSGGFGIPIPGGGGGFSIPIGEAGGGGLVAVLVIVGIGLLFGVDPRVLLGNGMQLPGGSRQIQLPNDRAPRAVNPEDEQMKQFVSVILADTEDTWSKIFREQGRKYISPKLTLFHRSTQSGCGAASVQMGPFYCPTDRKIWIDLSFYETLKRKFHAPGEFAQAYVIAHEVGHHVQNLLGRLQSARHMQSAASGTADRNGIQVRVELQADCYAGVWAKNTDRINKILEPGEIDQALRAAAAIGDDAIQKSARGYAVPDSFTHGTSQQRTYWFKKGYDSGAISACDTFSEQTL